MRFMIWEKYKITVGLKKYSDIPKFASIFMNIETEKYFLKMVIFVVVLQLHPFCQGFCKFEI